MWFLPNCPGGALTVTIHTTASSTIHIRLYEISGASTTGQPDASNSGDDATNTSHTITTTGSVTLGDQCTIAVYFSWNVSNTFTADAAYTSEAVSDSGGGDTCFGEHRLQTSASGTQTAACTFGTTDTAIKLIASYKGIASSITAGEMMAARQLGTIDPPRDRIEIVSY
jgi:hypothetical protein